MLILLLFISFADTFSDCSIGLQIGRESDLEVDKNDLVHSPGFDCMLTIAEMLDFIFCTIKSWSICIN